MHLIILSEYLNILIIKEGPTSTFFWLNMAYRAWKRKMNTEIT